MRPKRSLETYISKKIYLPCDKLFWFIFSCSLECDKPQGTINRGLRGTVTFTVEVIRSLLRDLKGCCKHEIFIKKATSRLSKIFCNIIEHEKRPRTSYKGSECPLTIFVQNVCSFLYDLRGR